tara:strand:- start:5821 stop:9753 length:3933 start_codon:yes stop_codon:yes gene_type:complete
MIASLATRLSNDPDQIYEFVKNTIDYTPAFGVQKGAVGAYLDSSGTAFDQAELMDELLGASAISSRIVLGRIQLDASASLNQFGTSNASAVASMLGDGGIPASVTTNGTSVGSVEMVHAWVEAQIGGVWYAFDPSLKQYTKYSGGAISQLTSMQVGTGGANDLVQGFKASSTQVPTSGVTYWGGLNASALRTYLSTKASGLVTDLSQPALLSRRSVDLLGGKVLDREFFTSERNQQLPNQVGSPIATWVNGVPDSFKVHVTVVSCTTADYFVDEQIRDQFNPTPGVITYQWPDPLSASRRGSTAEIPVDYQSCGDGNVDITSRRGDLSVTVDHPYAANGGDYADFTYRLDAIHGFAFVYDNPDRNIILRVDLGQSRTSAGDAMRKLFSDTGSRFEIYGAFGIPRLQNTGLKNVSTISDFFARLQTVRLAAADLLQQSITHHHTVAIMGAFNVALDWTNADWSPPYSQNYTIAGSDIRVVSMASAMSVADLGGDAAKEVPAAQSIGALLSMVENFSGLNYEGQLSTSNLFETHMDQTSSDAFILFDDLNFSTTHSALSDYDAYTKGVMQRMISDGYTLIVPERRVGHELFYHVISQGWKQDDPYFNTTPKKFHAIVGFRGDGSLTSLITNEVTSSKGYTFKGGSGNVPSDGVDQIGLRKEFADALNAGLFNTSDIFSVEPETGNPVLKISGAGRSGLAGTSEALSMSVTYPAHVANSKQDLGFTGLDSATGLLSLSADNGQTELKQSVTIGYDLDLQTGVRTMRDGAQFATATLALNKLFASSETDTIKLTAASVISNWLLDSWREGVVTVNHGTGGVEQFVKAPDESYLAGPQSLNTLSRTGTSIFVPPLNKRGYKDVVWSWSDGMGASKEFRYIQMGDTVGQSGRTPQQILTCFNDIQSGGFDLKREAEFWGVERPFMIVSAAAATGTQRTFAYDNGTEGSPGACTQTEPYLYQVTNSFARSLTGTSRIGVSFKNDANDIVRLNTFGCLSEESGDVVFFDERGFQLGGTYCSGSNKLLGLGYYSQNDVPIVLAGAADCEVFGSYGGSIPLGAVKTGCRTQNYYLGRDMVPFAKVDIDPFSLTVLSYKDAAGNESKYRVVPEYQSKVQDPLGHVAGIYFDAFGNAAYAIDKEGRITESTFDAFGHRVEERSRWVADAPSVYRARTTFVYDDLGNQIQQSVWPGTDDSGIVQAGPELVTLWKFEDPSWPKNPTKEIDPEGYATSYVYGAKGLVIRTVGPFKDATPTVSSDDASCSTASVPCSETDYDQFGRVLETRIKTESGAWRRSVNLYSPSLANHYRLDSVTQYPEGQ